MFEANEGEPSLGRISGLCAVSIAAAPALSGNDTRPESRGFKKLSEFGNSSLQRYESFQKTCFIVFWCSQICADDP